MQRITLALLVVAIGASPLQAQSDPADSLYRTARTALNGGDYGRAAKLFSDLVRSYPNSPYVADAPYWEAQARYKIGTTDQLRTAAKLLEPLAGRIARGQAPPSSPGGSFRVSVVRRVNDGDVAGLYARINGVLAKRGDRDAAIWVAKAAEAGTPVCDQEEMQVQVEALNALSQMDVAASTPILRSAIQRKDECSVPLRRNAVFMLGRHVDADAASLLIAVAKSDPNTSVRSEAIGALARLPGEIGYTALDDLLRNEQDERIQRTIVSALMRSDNPKARTSMRALIDRRDAPINLRIEAIGSLTRGRATSDDATYLRGLYAKAESDNLRRAIIGGVSRIGGPENEQWVLAVAKNPGESSSVRSEAISQMMRSSIRIADIAALYDAADSYDMRTQIVSVLKTRKEPEAADKLIEIAKTSTDYRMKMQALNALTSRGDPRTQQLLVDILKPE